MNDYQGMLVDLVSSGIILGHYLGEALFCGLTRSNLCCGPCMDILAMCNCTKAVFAAWTGRKFSSFLVYPAVDGI